MAILVTGGTGYIGSHTVIELINNNLEVIIIDNLSNSNANVLEKIRQITGKDLKFYETDILDEESLRDVFKENEIEACIHFAALKAPFVSISNPIEYYHNNIEGTLSLIKIMKEFNCKKLIHSSSAAIYGESEKQPITENCSRGICTNPYGWSKSMLEQILTDLQKSDPEWHIILLRYFNPIGAHQSGLIGEDPTGIPNNIMPYITQVAVGKLEKLNIFGDDYDTKDGTCIRDFIHVIDLAIGHVKAIEKLKDVPDLYIYNLGTGKGYTILELVKTFEKVSGKKINYEFAKRRKGDVLVCYADVSKAKNDLSWTSKYNLEDMCRDSWNWQKKNPNGYNKK